MASTNVQQFPFKVRAPDEGVEGNFNATVVIETTPETLSNVLHYIRSVQIKNDFMNQWVKKNAPGHGLSLHGGPRPVFQEPGDRTTPVVAYEQDFRLSRPI